MGQQFFYTNGSEEVGPVSAAELKQAAESGKLKPTDQIRKEGSTAWTPAAQARGLFPDGHDKVRQAAGQVEKTAATVSKVARATGKVADAVTDVAEAGEKVGKAVTAVAGLSAGGSTMLGGVGDFLRPLGPVNLIVFGLATASGVVLFVLARRRGAKVKLKVKAGTVASLCIALVFALWSGLGAVAGKDDRGVLATHIPAVERAQVAVLPPVKERPDPGRSFVQGPDEKDDGASRKPPVTQPKDNPTKDSSKPPEKVVRTVKGWVDLMETPGQVQAHWRHGSSNGFFLYDADRRTMKIENVYGLGRLVHPAPWREFRFEVDVPDRFATKFELKVYGTHLDVGPALFAGKFPAEVVVRYDPETEDVQALVGDKVVQKERARKRHREPFDCELYAGRGPRQRDGRNLVLVRKARLLVTEYEGKQEVPSPRPEGKTRWLPLCETQEQVFQHWKHGSYLKGNTGRVTATRYDPEAKAITLTGWLGVGEFRHKGRWKEFECTVEPPAGWDGTLELVVNRVGLPIGAALAAGKGGRKVAVRLDEAGHLLIAEVDGMAVCKATVTGASWRRHHNDGIELSEGFSCGFRLGRGRKGKESVGVVLRDARLLVIEP